MPELPEVQVLTDKLKKFEDRKIVDVRAQDENVYASPLKPEKMNELCINKRLNTVERLGKYILLEVGTNFLLVSLRMTGQFLIVPECSWSRHDKLLLKFDSFSDYMIFRSIRRLSNIHLLSVDNYKNHEKIKKLGPDPTDVGLDDWERLLEKRRGPIKSVLMDQSFLAGLGNIYANEICFRAGVDPRRNVPDLSLQMSQELLNSTKKILREAIAMGGSSISDFTNANGKSGGYQCYYRVYDRAGNPCLKCGNSIEQIKLSGRGTYYCSTCQI